MGGMADIRVKTETDSSRGWTFAVELADGGRTRDYTVTLSWSDYDHWSHGRVAPERVVQAAFEFLLARESADQIMSQFDCAIIRRYFPEVDSELPKGL
jgi:spore germination protein YaaH